MAEYMLDTDISSYIMKRSHEKVLRRLQKIPIAAVCISVITKSEVHFELPVSRRLGTPEDFFVFVEWKEGWLRLAIPKKAYYGASPFQQPQNLPIAIRRTMSSPCET